MVTHLCTVSVWPAVWHPVRIPPTPAPMADLPTVAISSPSVAILTELHSGAKEILTSVCSCITNCVFFPSRCYFSHTPPKRTFLYDPHPSSMEGCRRQLSSSTFFRGRLYPSSSLQLIFSLLRQQVQDFYGPST